MEVIIIYISKFISYTEHYSSLVPQGLYPTFLHDLDA